MPLPERKQTARRILVLLAQTLVVAFFFTQWARLEGQSFYLVGALLAIYLHYLLIRSMDNKGGDDRHGGKR